MGATLVSGTIAGLLRMLLATLGGALRRLQITHAYLATPLSTAVQTQGRIIVRLRKTCTARWDGAVMKPLATNAALVILIPIVADKVGNGITVGQARTMTAHLSTTWSEGASCQGMICINFVVADIETKVSVARGC